MFKFVQEVQGELTKVTWPSRTRVLNLTITVIALSVIVGIYLGTLDFLFTKLLELVIQ